MPATRRRRTKEEIARQRNKLKVRAEIVSEQEKQELAREKIKALRMRLRGM